LPPPVTIMALPSKSMGFGFNSLAVLSISFNSSG
jgi:hypothetical protein